MTSPSQRWLAAIFLAGGLAHAAPSAGLLTTAAQVRALTTAEAERHLPVRLRGVFLGATGSPDQGFVIADATEGIYLEGAVSNVTRGQLVEVDGMTDPGGFAPFVRTKQLRVIGQGKIPAPRAVHLGELNNGGLDAQWVEVTGIVRTCEPMLASERPAPPPGSIIPANGADSWNQSKSKLYLTDGDERLVVQVNDKLNPADYVDAEVRLRGICFSQHNASRQFLNPLLLAPHGVPVEIIKPPSNPFALPVQPLSHLLAFSRDNNFGHRVHVRGSVTYQLPGKYLWVRDGNRGLRAQSGENIVLQPGDDVDIAGFPTRGQYTPVLEDAISRKIGAGPPVLPVPLNDIAAALNHDSDLVGFAALLVGWRQDADGCILEFDWNGSRLEALLASHPNAETSSAWQPGSRVRVSGICSVLTAKNGPVSGVWQPKSFQLLLRTPADLAVIQPPPWWTYQHIMFILGMVAVASVLAVAIVLWVARRKLRAEEISRTSAESEFTAILSERNRMAREIHDTLAQGLAATSVQLRLAKKNILNDPATLGGHIDAAQQLVLESLTEARNSIWNMRPHILENNDLVDALSGILRQLSQGTPIQTDVHVTGKRRRLAPIIENNLLRVGQEAITNATRHARAQRISLQLDFAQEQFCLRVIDDGQGFDTAQSPRNGSGFGLVGIRERASQLKGILDIQSVQGRGTAVILKVQLNQSE